MPYIINTIVLDDAGYPLQQVAVMKEVSENVGQLVQGNATSDETGKISFVPLSMGSTVEISSVGYKSKTFPAFEVPNVVLLEPSIVIEGKTTTPKKEDNTIYYVAGAIALAAAIAIIARKSKKLATQPEKKQQPGLKIPVINI